MSLHGFYVKEMSVIKFGIGWTSNLKFEFFFKWLKSPFHNEKLPLAKLLKANFDENYNETVFYLM